jgi:hypothetical protein
MKKQNKADTKEIEVEATEKKSEAKKSMAEKFADAAKGSGKKTKIEFTSSPTGILLLGYAIGDVAEFEEKQADLIVDLGLGKKA